MSYKLSPSSLNLMGECPRCFWLDKHKLWKRPSSIFPSLPSGMDSILKTHFDNFRDRGLLPPELCQNDHCQNLKLFDNKDLLRTWRNNLQGIRWKDKDGNILFGAVDNIMTNGEKLIVLDYKTRGFALKEDSHEYYQNQLDLYNFLLQKNGYETEDYAFLLFYFPKTVLETGEIIFENVLKKINVNPKNAENLFNSAITLLNEDCPKKTCTWCEAVKIEKPTPIAS